MATSVPSQRPAQHASRTQTIAPTPTPDAGPSNPDGSPPPIGVLRLRGGPVRRQKVVWSEGTVDNEGMGRKKSKICCIYHKPKAYDESSSESPSSSGDEGNSERKSGTEGVKKGVQRRREQVTGKGKAGETSESESEGGQGNEKARPPRNPRRHRHHQHSHDCDHSDHPPSANRYDHQGKATPKDKRTT